MNVKIESQQTKNQLNQAKLQIASLKEELAKKEAEMGESKSNNTEVRNNSALEMIRSGIDGMMRETASKETQTHAVMVVQEGSGSSSVQEKGKEYEDLNESQAMQEQ